MKKDTWIPWPRLTQPAFPATAHLRGLFAQSEESEEEVALLQQVQELKLLPCCLAFVCLSFTAGLVLLRCGGKFP